MKKIKLALAIFGLLSSSVMASDYCQYDVNTETSSNSIITPPFFTVSNWQAYFHITNISDVPVTVKWSLTNTSGNAYSPTTVLYSDKFSSSNTPLNLQNGATLQPGEMGEINIQDNGVRTINVGELSWTASGCINEALVATMRSQSTETSRMASNLLLLNDGKPF